MLGKLRERYQKAIAPIGKILANFGFSPNLMTIISLIVAIATAYIYTLRMPVVAALFVVLTSVIDMFDGAIARTTGRVTKFGATLDHVIDRYAEFFIVIGIIYAGYTSWIFGFFTLFPVILLFSRSFWPMVVAFVIRGMKEFGEPTRKALIMDLAPEGRKASTFGVYYLLRDIVVSVAAFGGAWLWNASMAARLFDVLGVGHDLLPWIASVTSPATNFLVAFGFGIAGTLYFALFGKDLKSTQMVFGRSKT